MSHVSVLTPLADLPKIAQRKAKRKSRNSSYYKVHKNVPLKPAKTKKVAKESKYPLTEMKIGDSFLAPAKDTQRVKAAAYGHGITNKRKYTVRKVSKTTVRTWRIA